MDNQSEPSGAAFGRGMAGIVTSSFGFIWLAWGLSMLRNVPGAIWVALYCVAAGLIVFAIVAVRRGKRLMRAEGKSRSDFWKARRKPFVIVSLLEVAGCIVVVVLANLFRRPNWIAVGISLVVGLHFLPLGRIFGVAAYYWVGGLIVIWDLLTVTALRGWNPTASVGIATGAILWATSIYVLMRSFSYVPLERSV